MAKSLNSSSLRKRDNVRLRSRDHHDRFCCQCRTMETKEQTLKRCARCKLTIYCSRDCQVRHYRSLHKMSCKALESFPKDGESDGYADFLFQVAYRSNDTPSRSADMMEQVLDAYYNEGQLMHTIFLLASLGHYKEAVVQMYESVGFDGLDDTTFSVWDDILVIHKDKTIMWSHEHILTVALIKLKLIIHQRKHNTGLTHLQTAAEDNTGKLLDEQERQLRDIVSIRGGERMLLAIRDSIPLKQQDVSPLFHACPSEFFLFIQDCFLLEPGLNDLLHEFVREEEYGE